MEAPAGEKIGTVTVSLCLVFKGRSRILAPPLIKSIKFPPLEKKLVKSGKYDIDFVLLCSCEFRDIFNSSSSRVFK